MFARCRFDDRTKCCLQFPSDQEVQVPGGRKLFKFDKVFSPKATQEEVGVIVWCVCRLIAWSICWCVLIGVFVG